MSTKRRNGLTELVVHIGAGFVAKERPHVREALASLRPHLGRSANDVSVEVSLQDRGRREQRVTLRTTLPGRPPVVAVAAHADLSRALQEAKTELIRQLEHLRPVRPPMRSRRLTGRTIRHPLTAPPEPGA
ncbi:Uncharacterised protein [Mycolicibacterium vanbaalenii]|uniref:Ribosome-associated translation inhibitor RaiA n=1 Tax=Mycolicibacterium vanbaalenii TaxID=110539 RepID=A0A5S9RC12_MYCVN|nr:hypothetical protein [Mycolicibacterium vanbaalenii]CAA0138164.1 Uncharacterised protein [Mycolicibacterium vanbaalenii]